MLCFNLSDIAIISVKDLEYRSIFYGISKSEAINLLKKLCLVIAGIHKMHINIKNQIYNFF